MVAVPVSKDHIISPQFYSLQNIEIALLTAPLVVVCVQLQDVYLLPGFQSCVYIFKIGFNLSHLTGLYNFLTVDLIIYHETGFFYNTASNVTRFHMTSKWL